jgi:CubicO group peptidase (beta-lactamase class C family)
MSAAAVATLRNGSQWPSPAEEPEASAAQLREMRREAEAFRANYGVPGLEVSIARHGRLVYEQAFGFADRRSGDPLTPAHLFRIASVSKPITSVAIFTLVEQGRLSLADSVFGPRGVLGNEFGPPPYRRWVEDLRLEHLLTHTGGGWENDKADPMFRNPSMSQHELIVRTLVEQPLQHAPGQHYGYSNFGYCVLGRVIEKVGGHPYPHYVRQEVLAPCEASAMRIAGSTLGERAQGEVVYDGQGENPYGMNVQRMDAHGGWLASASDLVRFATHVDGFSAKRNILKPATIRVMTTASAANPGYAKGWEVNSSGNWWHNGSLPGTSSLMVRTASGLCWAGLANTRRKGIDPALDELLWRMARRVPVWLA